MGSILFMALDIGSPVPEADVRSLRWSGRVSLAWRILLVNLLPILLLAGSLFYLDTVKNRLLEERAAQARSETYLIATMLTQLEPRQWAREITRLGQRTGSRVRLVENGRVRLDSWRNHPPTFRLTDPSQERWDRKIAAVLDDGIDAIVSAPALPRFSGFNTVPRSAVRISLAEDRTHVLTAQAALPGYSTMRLVTDRNVRDVRRLVRAERSRLGLIFTLTLLASVLLSRFLARTIVRPLGALALAAERVRLGRERDIVIPRLARSDPRNEDHRGVGRRGQGALIFRVC